MATTSKETKTKEKPAVDPSALAAGMNEPDSAAEHTDNQQASIDQPTSAAETVLVEMPVHSCLPGFATNRVDISVTSRQAAALKVLWSSLAESGARYSGSGSGHPDGKVVDSSSDGLRWMLDRLADAIEAQSGKQLISDFDLVFR